MAEKREQRRKNIGFKAKGANQAHDMVFAVLEVLPRGAISDFVVMAVMEYLENHSGEIIRGSKERKYIVLKRIDPSGDREKESPEPGRKGKGKPRTEAISQNSPAIDMPANEGIDDRGTATEGSGEAQTALKQQSSYTELDDETLDNLVLGFGPQTGK